MSGGLLIPKALALVIQIADSVEFKKRLEEAALARRKRVAKGVANMPKYDTRRLQPEERAYLLNIPECPTEYSNDPMVHEFEQRAGWRA